MKTLEKIREMKSKVKAELDEAAPKMRYALVGKDMKIYSMGSDERDLRLDRRSLERRFKNVAPLKMARLKTAQALGDKVDKSQIKEEVETVDEKTSSADLAKAMAAFRAKGGKVKKVAPGKAQGAHGKDDLGTGMMGILNRGDTSRFKTKKRGKIKSMSAGTEVEVVNKSEADGK